MLQVRTQDWYCYKYILCEHQIEKENKWCDYIILIIFRKSLINCGLDIFISKFIFILVFFANKILNICLKKILL